MHETTILISTHETVLLAVRDAVEILGRLEQLVAAVAGYGLEPGFHGRHVVPGHRLEFTGDLEVLIEDLFRVDPAHERGYG